MPKNKYKSKRNPKPWEDIEPWSTPLEYGNLPWSDSSSSQGQYWPREDSISPVHYQFPQRSTNQLPPEQWVSWRDELPTDIWESGRPLIEDPPRMVHRDVLLPTCDDIDYRESSLELAGSAYEDRMSGSSMVPPRRFLLQNPDETHFSGYQRVAFDYTRDEPTHSRYGSPLPQTKYLKNYTSNRNPGNSLRSPKKNSSSMKSNRSNSFRSSGKQQNRNNRTFGRSTGKPTADTNARNSAGRQVVYNSPKENIRVTFIRQSPTPPETPENSPSLSDNASVTSIENTINSARHSSNNSPAVSDNPPVPKQSACATINLERLESSEEVNCIRKVSMYEKEKTPVHVSFPLAAMEESEEDEDCKYLKSVHSKKSKSVPIIDLTEEASKGKKLKNTALKIKSDKESCCSNPNISSKCEEKIGSAEKGHARKERSACSNASSPKCRCKTFKCEECGKTIISLSTVVL